MLVRTYRAKDFKAALSQVKADLGDDATVLSSRKVRSGLLRNEIEVTAAFSAPPALNNRAKPAEPPAPKPNPALSIPRQVARCISPMRTDLRALRNEMQQLVATSRLSEEQMSRQVENLRAMLAMQRTSNTNSTAPQGLEAAGSQMASASAADAPLIVEMRTRLEGLGLHANLANELVLKVAEELPQDPAEAQACITGLTTAALQQAMTCVEPAEASSQRQVLALVGTPKAGKSSLIAKIAARATLLHNRKVALVGCDIHRLGVEAGLESTARACDIPWSVAQSEQQLIDSVRHHDQRDLVLIDTSGYAPQNIRALRLLGRTLDGAGATIHLVANADQRSLDVDKTLEGFQKLRPSSVSFTKIDRAVALGSLINVVAGCQLPLMYLSNGPQIPDDVEPATQSGVAALIMGVQYN